MEILSIGEKIKRARIYQGITLKELCDDKISISKMSCIENNKIKVDNEILRYIADKLQLDYKYLVQGVKEQLLENINLFENNKSIRRKDLIESIKYNLKYAIEYNYTDIGFKLFNKLFNEYLMNENEEKIQELVVEYTELHNENEDIENSVLYYMDMARFFLKYKEYDEAITYYNKIKEEFLSDNSISKDDFVKAVYNISYCYSNLNKLDEAYQELKSIENEIESIKSDEDIFIIYSLFTNLTILCGHEGSERFEEKAMKFANKEPLNVVKIIVDIAKSYFKINDNKIGINQIKKAIKIMKEAKVESYPEFLIDCVDILYQNDEYELAIDMIEEALNLAIQSNKMDLIEKAYYLKGMILQKQGKYIEAENYMNIAIDSLIKFATEEEKYIRYNEMGELYYNLGEVKESIKYFTLAMNIKKQKIDYKIKNT